MEIADTGIRRALPSDAGAIARVHVASWQTTYLGIIPDGEIAQRTLEKRENYWREALSGTVEGVFVAEEVLMRIVGFASCGPAREDTPGFTGELYAIYLLDRVQRQGIGRGLVRAVAQELLGRGIQSMFVWVLENNPSRAFYEALGGKPGVTKQIIMGNASYVEVAYGWEDIDPLAR